MNASSPIYVSPREGLGPKPLASPFPSTAPCFPPVSPECQHQIVGPQWWPILYPYQKQDTSWARTCLKPFVIQRLPNFQAYFLLRLFLRYRESRAGELHCYGLSVPCTIHGETSSPCEEKAGTCRELQGLRPQGLDYTSTYKVNRHSRALPIKWALSTEWTLMESATILILNFQPLELGNVYSC